MAMVNSRSKAVFLLLPFATCRIRSSNPSQQHLMQKTAENCETKKNRKNKKKLDILLRF